MVVIGLDLQPISDERDFLLFQADIPLVEEPVIKTVGLVLLLAYAFVAVGYIIWTLASMKKDPEHEFSRKVYPIFGIPFIVFLGLVVYGTHLDSEAKQAVVDDIFAQMEEEGITYLSSRTEITYGALTTPGHETLVRFKAEEGRPYRGVLLSDGESVNMIEVESTELPPWEPSSASPSTPSSKPTDILVKDGFIWGPDAKNPKHPSEETAASSTAPRAEVRYKNGELPDDVKEAFKRLAHDYPLSERVHWVERDKARNS